MSGGPETGPEVAVLIPIFRHSALMIEAVESVLAQTIADRLHVVLIDDGCPFPETGAVCREYATTRPGRVTWLRKPNGGLSDARNHGIRHVLAHLPTVEAVYLMDADNRLLPVAMERSLAALRADPAAGWIYPDIEMFGLDRSYDYGGDYSLLIHTEMNICEAGSLIRRAVFEAGVFFDTGFRKGWEDWDFFLRAAEAGFRGRHLEHFGFRYRKRPESMLAESERDQPALTGAIRDNHPALMTPRSLVRLEQREAPRYAIHSVQGGGAVQLCVDPLAPGTACLDAADFETAFWRAAVAPGRYRVPPFTIGMDDGVQAGLRAAGLLHWALWTLETMLRDRPVAVLTLGAGGADRLSIRALPPGQAGSHVGAVALAVGPELMQRAMREADTRWIDSLTAPVPEPGVTALELSLPAAATEAATRMRRPSAVFDALSLIHRLRASEARAALSETWSDRTSGIPFRGREHQIVRSRFDDAAVYPRLPDGQRHVGFVLPLAEFGGVEKVALQMARGLRAQGFVPHAVILEAWSAAVTPDWQETFESTGFFGRDGFRVWGAASDRYFGTPVQDWTEGPGQGTLIGMLHWFDAVINFHGGAVAAVMGRLRKMGVVTVDSLHLNDQTAFGRPVGNTYLGLAFEHAFDLFAPCSHRLGHWLHGMGVPDAKIVPVQNAPGFEADPGAVAEGQAARLARGPETPLRALFLGRLDRQKGLFRLAEVIERTAAEGIAVDWRVVGKAVLGDGDTDLPPAVAARVEPGVTRPEELTALYAWADVVVLLSGFEGLPLTILEAMRAGAVPVATDVGAVSEVLRDGETGLLLPLEGAAAHCTAALRRLSEDRAALHALSARAHAERAGYDWVAATRPLATRLGQLTGHGAAAAEITGTAEPDAC